MRKILSALLAVMMLISVVAVLPAFAADEPAAPVVGFDGTKEEDWNDVDLVVTEIMTNSKSHNKDFNEMPEKTSTSKTSSYDNYDFIEIYNRGDEAVNLYDYCLLSQDFFGASIPYKDDKVFARKNYIVPGTIYQTSGGVNPNARKHDVTNPTEMAIYDAGKPASQQLHWLKPGEFAVIWFWTSQCDTVSTAEGKSMAAPDASIPDTENAHYFPKFREFYNVPDDTIVLAVYGQNNATNAANAFDLTQGQADMYAIADKDFSLDQPAFTVSGSTAKLDPMIECLFAWGTGTKVGIPTTDGTDHMATVYLPPVASPDLYNAEQKMTNKDHVDAKNFVENGYTISYKEMAIYRYAEEPSVGRMPLYQWAYIDPTELIDKWGELETRTNAELRDVVRAIVYAEFETTTIPGEVEEDNVPNDQRPNEIKQRLAEANVAGGRIDQVTDTRLADPEKRADYFKNHYETLARQLVDDYDEVIAYEVRNDKGEDTGVSLLFDEDGQLLTAVDAGGNYAWQTAVIARHVSDKVYHAEDLGDRDEVKVEANLQDREDIEAAFGEGAGTPKYKVPPEYVTVKKLTTWGLILVIAGAVIGAAGVAVAIILVIKKKNKPVAADDVAAEGEVQIIDETADETAEAPVVEAAAEEAPAEEAPSEDNN